jgi:tRNA U38,U39,U40 pseudouridine synthase TruA
LILHDKVKCQDNNHFHMLKILGVVFVQNQVLNVLSFLIQLEEYEASINEYLLNKNNFNINHKMLNIRTPEILNLP